MAFIENITTEAEVVSALTTASDDELFATDLVQRGAIDALERLLEFGVSKKTVDEMLESCRSGHEKLIAIATQRGLALLSEE